MCKSTIVRTVGTGLLLMFVLPALSVALPSMHSGAMLGGCHGQHEPMPVPSHSCCYARPEAPAQVQLAPSLTYLSAALTDIKPASANFVQIVFTAPMAHLAPPPPLILRI